MYNDHLSKTSSFTSTYSSILDELEYSLEYASTLHVPKLY